MTPTIEPLNNRVLLKPVERKEPKQGLIVIPESAKEKPIEKQVVAIGPDVRKRGASNIKVGSIVLVGQYAGTAIKLDGQEFVFVEDKEVLAVVHAASNTTQEKHKESFA